MTVGLTGIENTEILAIRDHNHPVLAYAQGGSRFGQDCAHQRCPHKYDSKFGGSWVPYFLPPYASSPHASKSAALVAEAVTAS